MKKKLVFAIVLITGMVAAFNVNVAKTDSGDISLLNIEMLSFGETGNTTSCDFIGSLDCPVYEVKVRFVW
jgi:spore coat protein U-like protein